MKQNLQAMRMVDIDEVDKVDAVHLLQGIQSEVNDVLHELGHDQGVGKTAFAIVLSRALIVACCAEPYQKQRALAAGEAKIGRNRARDVLRDELQQGHYEQAVARVEHMLKEARRIGGSQTGDGSDECPRSITARDLSNKVKCKGRKLGKGHGFGQRL